MTQDKKSPFLSKGVWGGLIAAATGAAELFGYGGVAVQIATIGGGLLASFGRLTAKKSLL